MGGCVGPRAGLGTVRVELTRKSKKIVRALISGYVFNFLVSISSRFITTNVMSFSIMCSHIYVTCYAYAE